MGRPVTYFEIGCRDRATAAFYAELFEWGVDEQADSSVFDTGGPINGHLAALGHESHTYTIFYVQVDDLAATLEHAASLGAKTLVGPLPIPDGRFAWIADPEGNTVGLIEPSVAP